MNRKSLGKIAELISITILYPHVIELKQSLKISGINSGELKVLSRLVGSENRHTIENTMEERSGHNDSGK